MELILMVVLPFPIGYLIRQRVIAYLVYIGAHAFTFTFQSLSLVREWVGGDYIAFDKDPTVVAWPYFVVNLVIYAVALGLVELGHRLAARRRRRSAVASVDLAT
jgi:hypothetical protein